MAEKLNINDNGFKASKLLLNGGGYLTKQLLVQKAVRGTVNTIDNFLTATGTKKQIRSLISKGLIKSSQNDILYPVNGSPTNLDDWDITLTTLLLSSCFKLPQSEKDVIQDVRDLRNTVYGHTAKIEMTDAEFAQNWSSITSALTKHSAVLTNVNCRKHIQDIIIEVSNETLSADKAIATLKQWYEWGIEVEQRLEKVQEDQHNRFDTFEKTATDRHAKISGQFQTLESSYQRIETDLSSIKKLMQGGNKQTVDVIELNGKIGLHQGNNKTNGAPLAAENSTVECLKFLKEKGINPVEKDHDGSSILSMSAVCGNITVLRYICDTYPDMIHDTDNLKRNAAHFAAQKGTVECLKFLIEQGINPRDKDIYGSTVLQHAAFVGNITVLRFICDTYPDMIHDTNNNKRNAAHDAVQYGTVECLKLLIEQGINPLDKDDDGSSILRLAAQCGNITVLRYICDTYPDMIHGTDNLKRNAAHFAARKGTVECLRFLIEQGINPRDKDNYGSTVIHHAAFVGNITVLRYICNKYPDIIHDTNNDERNAVHDVATNGTVQCLKFLIERGINPRDTDIDGSSILRLAVAGGNFEVLQYIRDTYPDIISWHR